MEQVQNGISSIDEVRDRLDMPPWGLQETSEPVVFTAQGPIPFSMAPQLIANMQAGGAAARGRTRAAHHVVADPEQPADGPPGRADEAERLAPGPCLAAPGVRHPRPLRRRRGDPVAGPAHRGHPVPVVRRGQPQEGRRFRARRAGPAPAEGPAISTWDARHIPARALGMIAEDIAKGVLIDTAVETRRGHLPQGGRRWAGRCRYPRRPGHPGPAPELPYPESISGRYEVVSRALARLGAGPRPRRTVQEPHRAGVP